MLRAVQLVVACVVVLVAQNCRAGIIIDVTGTPGSGVSRWSFSGSATVGGGDILIDNQDANLSFAWNVGTGFYSGTSTKIDFTSSTASFTANSIDYQILEIGQGFGAADNFGIAIDTPPASAGFYTFTNGTLLGSFSGFGVAPVDINEFAPGTTTASVWRFVANVQGTLPVTINVGAPSTSNVPEPSSLALLATGALGFMGYGWRRKRKLAA